MESRTDEGRKTKLKHSSTQQKKRNEKITNKKDNTVTKQTKVLKTNQISGIRIISVRFHSLYQAIKNTKEWIPYQMIYNIAIFFIQLAIILGMIAIPIRITHIDGIPQRLQNIQFISSYASDFDIHLSKDDIYFGKNHGVNYYKINQSKEFTFVIINNWHKEDIAFEIDYSDNIIINYTCPTKPNSECPKESFRIFDDVEGKEYIRIEAKFITKSQNESNITLNVYEPGYPNNKKTGSVFFEHTPLVSNN